MQKEKEKKSKRNKTGWRTYKVTSIVCVCGGRAFWSVSNKTWKFSQIFDVSIIAYCTHWISIHSNKSFVITKWPFGCTHSILPILRISHKCALSAEEYKTVASILWRKKNVLYFFFNFRPLSCAAEIGETPKNGYRISIYFHMSDTIFVIYV